MGSVQFQIVSCSGLYLFSRSIGPLQCLVNVNSRALICCTCHFQSGSSLFIWLPLFAGLFVSNFHSDTRGEGGHLFRLACSVVLWGGHCKQTSLVCVGCSQCVDRAGCPSSRRRVPSGSTLLRLQRALRGNCPKWTLRLVHFPGLSCSGSQVLRRGTDGWACVLCPSQVRTARATRGLASALSPVERASESPPRPGCSGPACPGRALCPVSPLGSRSQAAALRADVNHPGPRRTWLVPGSLHKQLGGGCRARGPRLEQTLAF